MFTARKRSLGQGNIFTPVCHSVHRGVPRPRGVSAPGGVCSGGAWSWGMPGLAGLLPGSAWSWGGAWSGRVSAPRGACSWGWGVPGGDFPRWLLLQAVHILLECILVSQACVKNSVHRRGSLSQHAPQVTWPSGLSVQGRVSVQLVFVQGVFVQGSLSRGVSARGGLCLKLCTNAITNDTKKNGPLWQKGVCNPNTRQWDGSTPFGQRGPFLLVSLVIAFVHSLDRDPLADTPLELSLLFIELHLWS